MSKNKYLSLVEKRKIVGKAYAQPNQIKATACQFHVQPAQIRCWQATIPSAGLEDNGAVVGTSKNNKTLHKGKALSLLNNNGLTCLITLNGFVHRVTL